jgi:hypothetical protein
VSGTPGREWEIFRLYDPMPWVEEAACKDSPVEWFFPKKGGQSGKAKEVCATCPVIEDCLYYAIENSEIWGIWGGMHYRERLAFARTLKEDVA